jgi:hypothetical protein
MRCAGIFDKRIEDAAIISTLNMRYITKVLCGYGEKMCENGEWHTLDPLCLYKVYRRAKTMLDGKLDEIAR